MTIFLWHQTAMMAVTATGLLAGRLPGLHTVPDDLGWVAGPPGLAAGVRPRAAGVLGRVPLLRAGAPPSARPGAASDGVRSAIQAVAGTRSRRDARHA